MNYVFCTSLFHIPLHSFVVADDPDCSISFITFRCQSLLHPSPIRIKVMLDGNSASNRCTTPLPSRFLAVSHSGFTKSGTLFQSNLMVLPAPILVQRPGRFAK